MSRPRGMYISSTSYSSTCSRLESPDLGSMSCQQSNSFKSCTGRCLPGYSFEGSTQVQITLVCRQGTWAPSLTFPPCISGGHCKLNIQGGGSYNCTTGMDGTRCDVFCNGMYQGRYHCFPGRRWEPSLPYCAISKEVNSVLRTPPCPCQNNGNCDSSGNCVCPKGWTGTYCEKRERKQTCPDPGIPTGGNRMTEDGTLALESGIFNEGQSLVFSCMDMDTALQGVSLIRCRKDGTWSAPRPQCIRDTIICPSPGIVSNANRINTDNSPSTMDNIYTPGQSVLYRCIDGYRPRGNSMITCLRSGQWSGKEPRCLRIGMPPIIPPVNEDRMCIQPEPDVNGFIEDGPFLDPPRRTRYPPGTQLTFRCRDGYRSVGPIMLYCLRTGDWSSQPPICEEATRREDSQNCPNMGPVTNGRSVLSEYLDERRPPQGVDYDEPDEDDDEFPPGTRLHITCKDKYILVGSNSLTCLPTGDWNPEPPFCVEDCGQSHLQTTHLITNGSRTEAGDWPWTVAIAATRSTNPQIICGGALINNHTVLTAAHCLTGYSFFTLYFGKYYRSLKNDDKVETRRTKQIIVHEDFNVTTYENDIALLSFEPSVTYSDKIKPICLPTRNSTAKNIRPGKKGSVAGWGLNELKLLSSALMVAQLPVQADAECMDSYEEHGLERAIHDGMFCAGYTEGKVSACRGDSGSPLVFLDGRTHRQTIEGVVSFGHSTKSCGAERVYTVFTKVAHYMPWILKNLEIL